jgi:PAS domain S-box-containing protein
MSAILLSTSVLLQFVAAVLSIRLIKITGCWEAWGFIALAMILMGVRRSITLYRVLMGDITLPPDLTAEFVALSISALMVAGVICIGPLFKKLASSNRTLQQQEAQLADAQRTAKLGIFGIDFRDGSTWWSDELYRRYGFMKEEFVPTYDLLFENMHANDRDRVREAMETFRQSDSEEAMEIEYRMRTESGNDIHIHTVFTPEKDRAGQTISCRCVSQDITERKQAEGALRESEHQLIEAQRMAHVGNWHWDTSTNIVHWSDEVYRIYGLSREDEPILTRERIMEALHPDDRDRIYKNTNQIVESGEGNDNDYRVIRPDGSVRTVSSWREVIVDEDKNIIGLRGTVLDITERKQAEDVIREHQQQLLITNKMLQDVLDAIPVCVFWKDTESIYQGCNERFASDMGSNSTKDLIGKNDFELFSKHLTEKYRSEDQHVMKSGKSVLNRTKVLSKTDLKKKYLKLSMVPLIDPDGNVFGVLGCYEDITEKIRTGEILKETEKLAATGRMVARIAHEINNPLSGIKNSLLLIEKAIPPEHRYYKYLELTSNEIARIAKIIKDMYVLYQPEQKDNNMFEIQQVVDDIITLLEQNCHTKKLKIISNLPDSGIKVRLPGGSFRQIIYNLLLNAIEASPQKGVITIRVEQKQDLLNLAISDQGEGIAEELHSRIFEPFFSKKEHHSNNNLGLGLSICRSSAEAMGGKLVLKSTKKGATTFSLQIPHADIFEGDI